MYKNTILNGVPKKKIMKKQIEDRKIGYETCQKLAGGEGGRVGILNLGSEIM